METSRSVVLIAQDWEPRCKTFDKLIKGRHVSQLVVHFCQNQTSKANPFVDCLEVLFHLRPINITQEQTQLYFLGRCQFFSFCHAAFVEFNTEFLKITAITCEICFGEVWCRKVSRWIQVEGRGSVRPWGQTGSQPAGREGQTQAMLTFLWWRLRFLYTEELWVIAGAAADELQL